MPNENYLGRQRHVLADLHIPDWDDGFLSQFDPKTFIDLCASSGADAAVVFCNSHSGESFWPTKYGKVHGRLAGRDIVAEQVDRLRHHGLAVCGYYSFIFNNWAYAEHPGWRIVASSPGGNHDFGLGSRYGLCCPNQPEYLEFVLRQTEELATGYSFDAFFYDMVFWPDICVCTACRDRYLKEEGAEIPSVIDWYAKDWCTFQTARARWLADAYGQVRDLVKASLDVPVFLNCAAIKHGWRNAVGSDLIALTDLVAGDFQGAGTYATLASYARLSPVMQYMNNISGYCSSVSQLKSVEEQTVHALAATAFGGQFMAIDAVRPDGSVNPAAYERLSEVFATMKPYEAHLGGTPVADIAVYSSPEGNVDFQDNGTALDRINLDFRKPAPHLLAVQGAVTALSEAHLPVGVISRADLGRLDEIPVIVVPNVLRMDAEEIEAFRRYVERGGRLYASGYTSLVTVDGVRHDDFLLADVFGTHFVGEETAVVTYVKPATSAATAWIAPVQYVTHGDPLPMDAGNGPPVTALRVTAEEGTQVVATTTLAYGEGRGTRDDRGWASVHTSPPWEDTSRPVVIRHHFGEGEVVYSAANLEAAGGSAGPAGAFFVGVIRSLLDREPTFEADTHPDLWITAFHEPEQGRIRLCLLNHASRFPVLPIPRITLRLAAPDNARFTGLYEIPTGEPIQFSLQSDGRLHAEIDDLKIFEMLAADYE